MEGQKEFSVMEWSVEHFSGWNGDFHEEVITSPQLQTSSGFQCTLELYPRGLTGCDQHMVLRVSYSSLNKCSGTISFIGSEGYILCMQQVMDFKKGGSVLILPPGPKFNEIVTKTRRVEAIHRDRLTVRLRLRCVPPSVHRVITKIKVKDITFKMDSSTFEPLSDRFVPLYAHTSRNVPSSVHIAKIPPFLSDKGMVEMALVAAMATVDSKISLKLRMEPLQGSNESSSESYLNGILVWTHFFVLDMNSVVLRSEENQHVFVNEKEWRFSKSLSRKEVKKEGFSLLLRVKVIPSKGYKNKTVVEFDTGKVDVVPTFRFEYRLSSVYNHSKQYENNETVLCKELLCLYQDKDLSDFRLKCGTVSFPVHRNILSARSPVFKSLLSSDMSEAASGTVDIEDLKPSTLSRLLTFLYSDSVEEMQWDSAMDLYYAADKYQVPTLKRECANSLCANVSVSNVCSILLFAEQHQDNQVTSEAHDFILKTYNAVMTSKEWENFMERDPQLAAKIVSFLVDKKGK